ncbi:EMP1-trafficking protein, putative [Plasmodium reichenowi]|uniref:EMP1-trafficking protein, putative n=1 Tax=Plasmodium reichenowi TaxID=5854 RepID=A0A151L685_PLARE|nr:EMP1-trafficking protein, putative [Plasmodium reichenowi]KYN94461.1 EMP1-trafficking protein, putative [Plasmodium reichenowi]
MVVLYNNKEDIAVCDDGVNKEVIKNIFMEDIENKRRKEAVVRKRSIVHFGLKLFLFSFCIWTLQYANNNYDYKDNGNNYTLENILESRINRSLSEKQSHIANSATEVAVQEKNSTEEKKNNPHVEHQQQQQQQQPQQQQPQQQQPQQQQPQQQQQQQQQPNELNNFENKLKDLKDCLFDKIDNAVDWENLSSNVKGYLEKFDSTIENKIKKEVQTANQQSNLMTNLDPKTQFIKNFTKNYDLYTPPLLLMLASAMLSENLKKKIFQVIAFLLFVVLIYLYLKLKKVNKNIKKDTNDNATNNNLETKTNVTKTS